MLKLAPYSKSTLTDGNYLNLQPFEGGWCVIMNGCNLGCMKKYKSGWRYMKGTHPGKHEVEVFLRAQTLLDEYLELMP